MPRERRWQTFPFDPMAVLYDPALVGASLAARGAYLLLLCHAWLEKEPGIMPYSAERFARLAGATPDEWKKIEPELLAAFDTKVVPGAWCLPLMRRTFASQSRTHKRLSVIGRKGGTISAEAKRKRRLLDLLEGKTVKRRISRARSEAGKKGGIASAAARNQAVVEHITLEPSSSHPATAASSSASASVEPPNPQPQGNGAAFPSVIENSAAVALPSHAKPADHGPRCSCELCWAATFPGART